MLYIIIMIINTGHHTGGELSGDININTPIIPETGHSHASEYQEKMNEHYTTMHFSSGHGWKTINKQTSPNFTHGDLESLLEELRRGECGVFKINLGFGSMLYDTVNQVYRYFYVSSNHFLFERTFTISTNRDLADFY